MPRAESPADWRELAGSLGGSFEARARGLMGTDLDLLARGGEPFGRMRLLGPKGAGIEAGGLQAEVARSGRSGYRMLSGGTHLTAEGPASGMTVVLDGRRYEARVNLLRNSAAASSPEGERAASVRGGATNRRYRAEFCAGDGQALRLALFLLYRTVALRRRAFLALGGPYRIRGW